MTAMDKSQSTQQRRGFWLRHLHRWHWISSAVCLVGMLLFAATGFTLNHAGSIGAASKVTHREARLPDALMARLSALPHTGRAALPPDLRDWLASAFGVQAGRTRAEWRDFEVYLSLPRPGGDAWVSIDRDTAQVVYESTDRGWIAWLNDLHKGRHAGPVWAWFIDVFALACVVFSLTGLCLLAFHSKNRAGTWPLVGLGLVIPVLLILLFVH